MIYLILAALCSASMAVALRLSEGYSSNKYAILTGNYVTCTFIAYILPVSYTHLDVYKRQMLWGVRPDCTP